MSGKESWKVHSGMDYSCCYRVVKKSRPCVMAVCKRKTKRITLFFLNHRYMMGRNDSWIPLCIEHEPRPQDGFPAVECEDEDVG